jgi:hypothetical protein
MPTSADIAKLRKNPFTLVADTNTDVWADYEDVRTALIDVITSCRTDQVGLSEFVVLHGEIGTGKSHALRYLQHYITVRHPAEFRSPCVYLESTKLAKNTDFLAIYRRVIEGLRTHLFDTAAKLDSAMEEKAREAGLTRSQDIQQEKDRLWKANAQALAPQFPSLILLLRGMANKTEHPFSILCGAKAKDLEDYQLTGPIDSEYDASRCFSSYVNLVTNPNRSVLPENLFAANLAFYLFIDEVELLQDFKPGDVLSINQGIRDLINGCPQAFCLIFGVSGDPRILFAIFDKFVVRRFSREPIEIQALDDAEAARFLKEVLRSYRADPSDPDEYPFREDALKKIAEKTPDKTAAFLFRSARRVLEKSFLAGRLRSGGWIEVADVDEFMTS